MSFKKLQGWSDTFAADGWKSHRGPAGGRAGQMERSGWGEIVQGETAVLDELAMAGSSPMAELALWAASRPTVEPTPAAIASAAEPVSVEALRGDAALQALRHAWERLSERQENAVLFQSPDMLAEWLRHYGRDRSFTVVLARRAGRVQLVWPLSIERWGPLRVARGAGAPIGQYDEILLDPSSDGKAAVAAALKFLLASARPDVVMLERVRANGALGTALQEYTPLPDPEGAPYADLSAGSAAFMASLKKRVATQQKKRVRKFEEQGVVGFSVAQGPEEATAWLKEALALKREWLRTTGRLSRAFVQPRTFRCLTELARRLGRPDADPSMVVSRLTLDGRLAAIEMGFRQRGTYHLYLGAFAPEFAKLGPGNVLTEKMLEWCAGNGIDRYDMLAPRSRNKSEWQSDEVLVFDYAIPATLRGRLYVSLVLQRLLPKLRDGFYALPFSVRSAVAGWALKL